MAGYKVFCPSEGGYPSDVSEFVDAPICLTLLSLYHSTTSVC